MSLSRTKTQIRVHFGISFWKYFTKLLTKVFLSLDALAANLKLNRRSRFIGEYKGPEISPPTSSRLVKYFRKQNPQHRFEGRKNLWIVKPGAMSRGRRISVYSNLTQIKDLIGPDLNIIASGKFSKFCSLVGALDRSNASSGQPIRVWVSFWKLLQGKWVAQKYIERPLLIHDVKFDIRQWFVVTDWSVLTVWMYRKSYVRSGLTGHPDISSNPERPMVTWPVVTTSGR